MCAMRNSTFDNAVNSLRLRILYSGYCQCDSKWKTDNLATAFCRLYIPESGEGVLRFGEEVMQMLPGYAYLLPPELPISYSCPDRMQKLFFHLSFLSPDHYDLFFGHNQILRISLPKERLDAYIALYHSQSYYSCLKLKQQLYGLLLDMYQQIPVSSQQIPSYSLYVRETIDYIHRNLSAQLTVGEMAKRLYISHTTLNKYFRAELGITVSRYIDDQLLMRAKAMLCHTDDSIGFISSSLGFSDPFYFSNRFKALSGFTPRLYRRIHTGAQKNAEDL